jgi:beta-N-acetylhexosaminidase
VAQEAFFLFFFEKISISGSAVGHFNPKKTTHAEPLRGATAPSAWHLCRMKRHLSWSTMLLATSVLLGCNAHFFSKKIKKNDTPSVPPPTEVAVVEIPTLDSLATEVPPPPPPPVMPPPIPQKPRYINPAGWGQVPDNDPRLLAWVDSVYRSLNDDERVGQLLMLRAHSDKGAAYEQEVEALLRQTWAAGLCFFQGTPERQAELTNQYQSMSRVPLLISMDAEYGLGMRLASCITFPRQMTLGAIRNDPYAVYFLGLEMARQCRRLGVHVSFSPSVDVNNNPANPVINDRSFGELPVIVGFLGTEYMRGLQDGGVLASAKHFPGHGDTDVDSHYALPVLAKSRAHLDSFELLPFEMLIDRGVGSVMVGHLNVPAYDARPKYPASLSRPLIDGLLRKQLKFNGLVFTDAMEMRAVTDSFPAGEAAVEALVAGNDVVLLPAEPLLAHAAIRRALAEGRYDRQQMETSVRRVLATKYRYGLTTPQRVEVANIWRDLNTPEAYALKHDLFRQAMTLVRYGDLHNDFFRGKMPHPRTATLALGEPEGATIFQKTLGQLAPMTHFGVGKTLDSLEVQRWLDTLGTYDLVYVSHHKTRSRQRDNFGLSPGQIELVNRLCERTSVRLTVFGNPYSLRYFDAVPSLLLAYTEDPMAQELAAQAWFGAVPVSGSLPVTASPSAVAGQSWRSKDWDGPLAYGLPEQVGMSSDTLALMDALVQEMIASGAAPGCQVLVAKNGKVVWHKAYGYHTYDQTTPVTTETIYDLASITKVAATTLSAMWLSDQGQLDVAAPMANYVPELRQTNKKDLKIGDILVHQAGLQAWIPFYEKTIDANKRPLTRLYRSIPDAEYQVPVAPNLWLKNAYRDTVWQLIFDSELRADKSYKYSDLTMYLTARAIENQSGEPVDVFAAKHFYAPMGLSTTCYNPWKLGLAPRCAPTEQDDYFRQQRVQGYVHDMGAAMLGGVSGHAGLFSNANDLAKLFQMLLDGGTYAGQQYLRPETVARWTSRYGGSTRRGLGFDMKELDPKATQNMSPLASDRTFGHAGFTGNVVWADPDEQLIFIFLSNRTFPTMTNNKLISGDYRPRLQSIAYRSIVR